MCSLHNSISCPRARVSRIAGTGSSRCMWVTLCHVLQLSRKEVYPGAGLALVSEQRCRYGKPTKMAGGCFGTIAVAIQNFTVH